jgi:hypothetical protein
VISNSIVQAPKDEDITLVLKPGGCDAFLPLIRENVEAAVHDQPRLPPLRRDGLGSTRSSSTRSTPTFDGRLATAHFKRFDVATRDLVPKRTVRRYAVYETARSAR